MLESNPSYLISKALEAYPSIGLENKAAPYLPAGP